MFPVSLIVAAAKTNGAIGIDGEIPWTITEDIAFFKKLTMGKTVIMGRKTWDSLPIDHRPLKGRINVVISTQNETTLRLTSGIPSNVLIVSSLYAAIKNAATLELPLPVFVIGGSTLYQEALKWSSYIYLTEITPVSSAAIDLINKCDTFFPLDSIHERGFRLVPDITSKLPFPGRQHGYEYRFLIYEQQAE